MPASSSDFVRVKRSSCSLCASSPSDPRRLMIDSTSRRRSLPRKYATVAWPASWVATASRSTSVYDGGLLRADLLGELGLHEVLVVHLAAAVAQRHQQALVQQVLDHHRRVAERLVREALAHLRVVELLVVLLALRGRSR